MSETSFRLEAQHDEIKQVLKPGEHDALYGHEAAFKQLELMHRSNHLPQALVLEGMKGIGKASFALHMAANLLKGNEQFKPFSKQDPLWRQVVQQLHGNFLHIRPRFDRDNKRFRNAILIDDIRSIHNFLEKTPQDPKRLRIILIDALDEINFQAANGLLKILEEPPKTVFFMLVCADKGRIMPTIKSRCQFLKFACLSPTMVEKALNIVLENDLTLSRNDQLDLLSKAKGSVREAAILAQGDNLKLLHSIEALFTIALLDQENLESLINYLAHKDHLVQYRQFIYYSLAFIAEKAKENSEILIARQWVELYFTVQKNFREAAIYNLDKKSLIRLTLETMHNYLH